MTKCFALVESTHAETGFRGLPALIKTEENLVPLGTIPYAVKLQSAIRRGTWIRWACRVGVLIVFAAAYFLTWWALLGLVALAGIEWRVAVKTRKRWMFLASILLGIDILTGNFAGWGDAYPSERLEAMKLQGDLTDKSKRLWLEFYLPRARNMDPALLKDFAPQAR